MVGDDGGGGVVAVGGFDLGEVLEDGDELDALAGAGGGEGGEVADGGDVGAFVEDEQQRRVEWLAGSGGVFVGGCDELLDEGREERLEAALFVGGCCEVERVWRAVEERLGR